MTTSSIDNSASEEPDTERFANLSYILMINSEIGLKHPANSAKTVSADTEITITFFIKAFLFIFLYLLKNSASLALLTPIFSPDIYSSKISENIFT